MIGLTPKQRDVLLYIDDYIRKNGASPTLREIAAAAGLGSHSNAQRYVKILEARGWLERRQRRARTLWVNEAVEKIRR